MVSKRRTQTTGKLFDYIEYLIRKLFKKMRKNKQ